MFEHKAGALARIAARRRDGGLDEYFDKPRIGHAQHSEAEPPAQIAETRVALAALAALRQSGSKPHLIAGRGALYALQDQFEVESELQLADHHDRRIGVLDGDDVATADLALDAETQLFQEAFDGKIQCRFQVASRSGLNF